MTRPKVLILGGGFGGLQVAIGLSGKPVDVTLVDRENHHLFQPLLYQVATAGLAPGEISIPIRAVVGAQKNVRVVLGEADSIDPDAQRVHLKDGEELEYDHLVVAVGAKTNYFGKEAEWEPHAVGLKTVRDALTIRERVLVAFERAERCDDPEERAKLTTFVVVGAGPTGVEMAGAISELGRSALAGDFHRIGPDDVRVLLVEMADRVLTAFDEDLSHIAGRQLEQLGVELRLGERVVSVDAAGLDLESERIDASVVVWGSGVKPVDLAAKSGLTLDRRGRIRTDANCAALGHSQVFAIGDVAAFIPEGEEHPLPGLGAVAMQQGKYVAKQIQRDLNRKPREPFKYKDRGTMATVGRSKAVVQAGMKLHGFIAWLAWCFVHVLLLVGFRNRLLVMINWVWSYVTFKRGARLITGRYTGPSPGQIQAAFHSEPEPKATTKEQPEAH